MYKSVLEELAKCEREHVTPKRETFSKKVKEYMNLKAIVIVLLAFVLVGGGGYYV